MFKVKTDRSRISIFYLDDVSLSSSAAASAPELNQLESPHGLPLEKQLF
jgi:hypothetical protein